jgi:hypothetical protein
LKLIDEIAGPIDFNDREFKRRARMNAIAKEAQVTNDFEEKSATQVSVRSRAEALADRIEQGAAELAAFAEALSEAEWQLPVSNTDRRTIGVIVHHVANMYPIEINLVRVIASGKAVTDVTWEAVAEINANHALEQADVRKADAIELLRRNNREAADAVRTLTDEELDQAAPLSLSFGAPVTTQFVIEDHPLRHAWHHLARIRKAVGR